MAESRGHHGLQIVTGRAAGPHGRSGPTVVLLAPHWESHTEEGWMTRQVGGALACVADVHVVTPDGVVPGEATDSVFTVHRMATPLDRSAELHRDLLVRGMMETGSTAVPDTLRQLVDQDLIGPWAGAAVALARLRPDLVVIAGHHSLGAVRALDAFDPTVPAALIALGSDLDSLTFSHFDQLFDRSRSVLAVTREEHDRIAGRPSRSGPVHRIGAPLAASSSALTEPDLAVGSNEYALMITDVASTSDHWENRMVDILRMGLPHVMLAVSQNDGLCVWHRGRPHKGPPVQRSGDLSRLMAWARVTIDLRPGRLLARRSIESLLYGTPIVVPHDSRAREHAALGQGGLWFASPAELTWCVEAMLDPAIRAPFGARGQAYAGREYGSTDRFIERVTTACDLGSATTVSAVSDAEPVAG